MPNVKTAISIEKSVFEQMTAISKQSKISRSRLFAIAAQEFIQRNKNLEMLKSLNEAYEDSPEIEPNVVQMRSTHYKIVKDQW